MEESTEYVMPLELPIQNLKLSSVANATRPHAHNCTLVLVSHPTHVSSYADKSEDILWASSDWLTWQKLHSLGQSSILVEESLSRWDADSSWADDFMLRVADPAHVGDEDITLFHGASLGRAFLTPAILFRAAAFRIEMSLRQILNEFKPNQIIYIDCRAETVGLSSAQRFQIASMLADEYKIKIVDKRPSEELHPDELPMLPEAFQKKTEPTKSKKNWRQIAAGIFEQTLDAVSQVSACLSRRRSNSLIMMNTSMTRPLFENMPRKAPDTRPMVFFRNQMKSVRFLKRAFSGSMMCLAQPKPRALSSSDHILVTNIVSRLKENLERPGGPADTIIADAVKSLLGDGDRIFKLAKDVCAIERFLQKYKPRRIIVDTPKNPPHIFYAEIGNRMGFGVDYIWHSPMMPETFSTFFLGGDPRTPAIAERTLIWGDANDRWIDVVAPQLPRKLVGSPIVGTYQNFQSDAPPTDNPKRALILEYSIVSRWLNALNATKYEYFIDATRTLERHGFTDIACKLHPGRPSKSYYEKIRDAFGLNCKILKKERLHDVLKKFDIVIGPIHSGSIFEAMAAGKEVYAFWCGPDDVVEKFYADYGLLRDVSELSDALKYRRCMNNKKILEDVYSGENTDAVAMRFWSAITDERSNFPRNEHEK
jgi:hypothetical protein